MTDRELDDPERDAEQNAWDTLLMFFRAPCLQDVFFLLNSSTRQNVSFVSERYM